MEFKQLEAYISVVKNRSFSKAAEELFLTQPTISSSINSLENELGVILLERGSKETRPTKEGRAFYGYAQNIINARERALGGMKKKDDEIDGILEIRASSIPANYLIPKLVLEFSKRYPLVKFNIMQMDTKKVWEDILDGFGEIGFTGAFERNRLKYTPLLKDRQIVITPDNEKFRRILKEKRKLRFEDIRDEKFIAREEGSATWNEFLRLIGELSDEALKMTGSTEKMANFVIAKCNSLEQVIALVKAGLGVSPVSGMAEESLPKGILAFELESDMDDREFYMVTNRDMTLSATAKKFTEFVEKYQFL